MTWMTVSTKRHHFHASLEDSASPATILSPMTTVLLFLLVLRPTIIGNLQSRHRRGKQYRTSTVDSDPQDESDCSPSSSILPLGSLVNFWVVGNELDEARRGARIMSPDLLGQAKRPTGNQRSNTAFKYNATNAHPDWQGQPDARQNKYRRSHRHAISKTPHKHRCTGHSNHSNSLLRGARQSEPKLLTVELDELEFIFGPPSPIS